MRTGTTDLLDNAPCGVIAFRDDGTVLAANRTLALLLGREPGSLVGKSIETILTLPSRIFHQTHFFPLLKLHGHADEIYLTLQPTAGEPIHVLANAVRHTREGEPRTDCVFVPIKERQKYEAQLLNAKKEAESANASTTRFLSMVSHDLRTPLGAISGYVDLLTMGIRGELNEQQKTDLERIRSLSDSLRRMVDDILHVARGVGELPLRIEPVSVSNVLSASELTVMPRIKEAGLAYHRSLAEDITVRADQDRLQRIIVNLLGNAIKFTPPGGQLTVYGRAEDAFALIQVSDTGRGIPTQKLGEIFKPFVQVEQSDAAKQGGVGLGLAISREFARAMGGDIDVQSAEGRGSVFTVRLQR